MTDTSCVKVAVRIRPQIAIDNFDKICTTVVENEPQIFIGKDKAFTFDDVFNISSAQDEIYNQCVKDLVQGCFEGYNATVLAYGQTGSGKTYTMGTGFDVMLKPQQRGIVPRAIDQIFQEVENRKLATVENGGFIPDIKIDAQFIELYNEEIIDLLDPVDANGRKRQIKIHEDHNGVIYCVGLFVPCINTVEEALDCLKTGSLSRTTASTQMNIQSSRSHAIFSIHIKQQRVAKMPSCTDSCNSDKHSHAANLNEFETLTAKFHFVDLAGSERLKRTQATGDRQKEGISINSGLLALGNVISALGDKSRRAMHVPYRDSKLTRLLQDSLGGNSRTLMIACISPSDRDFMETLNTLTYANRAKRIKNKVTVNMDKTSQTISLLREEVENLRLALLEYKQGKRIIGANGVECVNDMYHENAMLRNENNTLKTRVKALQETIEHLTARNVTLVAEKECNQWNVNGPPDIEEVVKGYIKEIETMRARLLESEELNTCLRNTLANSDARYSSSSTSTVAITGAYDIRSDSPGSVNELLVEAKDNVRKLKKKKKKLTSTIEKEAGDNSGTDEDKDIDEKNEDEDGDVIMPEDSSSESEEQDDYSANLAGLTCEISMKEKLIRQLEMQQRRMLHMQQCYEEKIIQLQTTIRQTEKERDTFNFNKGTEIEHNEKARRVNEDFERKINNLKKDMQKMEVAKKQHVNMMKNESHFASELAKLRNELAEMKRAKVVLVNKMKEEVKKHKESEHKKLKEITKLKKEHRTKDTRIKALEAEKNVKETVLKRKQEELVALRKRNKQAQTLPKLRVFSIRVAKQKWQTLEKKITKLVMNRQSIAHIEKDMNYYLMERDKLNHCLENVERKIKRAKTDEAIQILEEERSNLILNMDYAYEQIKECQASITQIDIVKGDMDAGVFSDFFKKVNEEECRYLTEKLLNMCINQTFQVGQLESNVKELEQQLQQVIENNAVQEQLLMHIIHQANENISGLILPKVSDSEDSDSSESLSSAIDGKVGSEKQGTYIIDNPRKKKARELAVTAEDILFSGSHDPGKDGDGASFTLEDYNVLENFPTQTNEAVISGKQYPNEYWGVPCLPSSPYSPNYSHLGSLTRPVTPDSTTLFTEMVPFIETTQSSPRRYLKCTHTAEGHKEPVICLASTKDVLFSGSRDCTVKIWDLNSGKEISQLFDHPSYVTKVRYCEYTRLAFTASMASIKIWDTRKKNACIQTLRSSGVSQKGSSAFEDRELKHIIPLGEHQINDIALNHYGAALFSAASGYIRMWDLRMYQSVASLNCGFQSNVSSITVDEDLEDENRVISGLTDHSIKVFEIANGSPGIHLPKCVLKPPHYDCIQALATSKGFLFSASTDTCIKKWDLNTMTLKMSLPPSSADWLCAFSLVPSRNLFLSGYRSGYLHLYSADTFEPLEELRAHIPAINAISSNETTIFTASDDSTIGIWKL